MDGSVSEMDLNTRRPVPDPNPPGLLGWPTKRLIGLDGMAPGLIRRLLSAAPMSRQAIFTAIAVRGSSDTAGFAGVLRDGKAREIIRHVHGSVPEGLLGALERVGGEPLPRPHYYDLLLDLFVDPQKRPQARALRHCGRISKLSLDAVAILEPQRLHPNILIHAESLRDVVEFQTAVQALQNLPHGPSDAAVEHALASMGPRSRLGSVIARLVRRTRDFPDQPVTRDADFQPLDSAAALIGASRRFRNCLRHHVMGALTGRAAYAVFRGAAIAEFRRLADRSGWLLYDVHAPRNDDVTSDMRATVCAACSARGIPCLADGREARTWDALLSMAEQGGIYDW